MDTDYRLLVTGSRRLHEDGRRLLREQLRMRLDRAVALKRRLVVVQGECETGADRDARAWALEMVREGEPVALEGHPAKNHPTQDFGEWPGAGPRRNAYMASLGADECVAFLDACTSFRCRRTDVHGSHGTENCVRRAEEAGITAEVHELWKAS